MKLVISLILVAGLLYSCGHANKNSKKNLNDLPYISNPANNQDISAELNLTGDPGRNELSAQIKLTNSGSSTLDVREIVLTTDEGVRSSPINDFLPFQLAEGKDTALNLTFNPTNDLKLYQMTGMQGSLKAGYAVTVSYNAHGQTNLAAIVINARPGKDEFIAYKKKYVKPVTGYSFNTRAGFNEAEKKYLTTIRDVKQPPFVYLSDQEIAVSGLNFRLKSYYRQDTLHAEIFVVNHSDFEVKLDTASLDIVADALPAKSKTISIEKISGSQQYLSMIAKDDRILIHFKKHVAIKSPGTQSLTFKLKKAFILKDKKTLFNQDLQLLAKEF